MIPPTNPPIKPDDEELLAVSVPSGSSGRPDCMTAVVVAASVKELLTAVSVPSGLPDCILDVVSIVTLPVAASVDSVGTYVNGKKLLMH